MSATAALEHLAFVAGVTTAAGDYATHYAWLVPADDDQRHEPALLCANAEPQPGEPPQFLVPMSEVLFIRLSNGEIVDTTDFRDVLWDQAALIDRNARAQRVRARAIRDCARAMQGPEAAR